MIVHYYSTKRKKLKIKKHFIQVVNLDNSDYFSTNWTFPRHFLQKCEKQKKTYKTKESKIKKSLMEKKTQKRQGGSNSKIKVIHLTVKQIKKNSGHFWQSRIFFVVVSTRDLRQFFLIFKKEFWEFLTTLEFFLSLFPRETWDNFFDFKHTQK